MKRIDSPKNETIKKLAKLKDRRHRDKEGLFLIEGVREVKRAKESGTKLEHLYYAPKLLKGDAQTLVDRLNYLPKTELSNEAFGKLSMRQKPDGLIALAPIVEKSLEELELPHNALVLVIDGLEKPGNIGALLRTADGANLDAVFVTGGGTDLFNPNVIRSSVGSVFSRPIVNADDAVLTEFLNQEGFRLVATMPDASKAYWETNLRGKVALLLGREHDGLSEAWQKAATDKVSIPMYGLADSLNVATAGALFIYEALRQRAHST